MEMLTIRQASQWASQITGMSVTESNISYLIQYGRVRKFNNNGSLLVSRDDLEEYYKSQRRKLEIEWNKKLGDDLNWALSFDNYKESERTKHVHRLHPYKGKFIPQLVEYFLDGHTDELKKELYFEKGDIVLDPFCGSGTTLVQANELGIHAVGVDISAFNSLISNTKLYNYDLLKLLMVVKTLSRQLNNYLSDKRVIAFDQELLSILAEYNKKYFPSPIFKYKVNKGLINEKKYGADKEAEFLPAYWKLIRKYEIQLDQCGQEKFLCKWYLKPVRDEIDYIFSIAENISELKIKEIVYIILSRTMRSCRATTHSDLATLKDYVNTTYYCTKHKKICKPLFSIKKWWDKYGEDTIRRLQVFEKLRTNTKQLCLTGDARDIDLVKEIEKKDSDFSELIKKKRIKGVFTSPPYVGLINYHEQHAYAYELFGFERQDNSEIGPLFNGRGPEARASYVKGISDTLVNCKKYLVEDYNIFIVANDKFNLYPSIAKLSGMKIVNQFKRPVLCRTEKDKGAYSESIFHLKKGDN